MKIPENLKYSKDHEWLRVEDGNAVIGITDYAQQALGDVVYIEFPKAGDKFEAHAPIGSVESVKAVSEIFTPVAGEVLDVNSSLNDAADLVNSDPYGKAWMVKLKMTKPGEADGMLSPEEYEDYLDSEK